MRSSLVVALGALASTATAQTGAAMFTDMMWENGFVQGVNYTISFTAGTGGPVSANLWSGNYSQPIFVDYTLASPYLWTVPDIWLGNYSMQLLQSGVPSDESPWFMIYAAPSLVNMTTTSTPTVMAATGTGTGVSATPYTYWDHHCGCTKTAMAPAPTSMGPMNYTTPPMMTPTVSQYMPNGADRIGGLPALARLGLATLFGVLVC